MEEREVSIGLKFNMNKALHFLFFIVLCNSNNSISAEYIFDASLLGPGYGDIDVSVFNNGGQLAGKYTVDVLLNDNKFIYISGYSLLCIQSKIMCLLLP